MRFLRRMSRGDAVTRRRPLSRKRNSSRWFEGTVTKRRTMRSVWHSLAWKEWQEHKWKLASIVAILWGVTALALLMAGQEMFDLALGLLFLSIVPLAVFVGLGAAANERSSGTLPFLQSLPVPMWRVALSKLLFGLLTIIAPIVLTVLLFY